MYEYIFIVLYCLVLYINVLIQPVAQGLTSATPTIHLILREPIRVWPFGCIGTSGTAAIAVDLVKCINLYGNFFIFMHVFMTQGSIYAEN